MNARFLLPALALGCLSPSSAQAPPAGSEANPMSDQVRDAIRKFKGTSGIAPEPADEAAPPVAQRVNPEPPPPPSDAEKPPKREVAAPEPPSEAPAPSEPPAGNEPVEPQPSLSVKVEKLQTGKGAVDPKSVTLHAPFPAKPLAAIPAGWHLEAPTTAPPFLRTVELAPEATVTLNIRPHLLVPDADATTTFSIAEPGFDPTLGYRQAHTIGAVLASAVQQLDENSKQVGRAIEQLEQLVMALPQPPPAPAPAPVAPAKPSNPRKP